MLLSDLVFLARVRAAQDFFLARGWCPHGPSIECQCGPRVILLVIILTRVCSIEAYRMSSCVQFMYLLYALFSQRVFKAEARKSEDSVL